MISMTQKELYDFFQKHLICESLNKDEVGRLTNYLKDRSYKAGEVIFDVGDIGDSLIFIIKGKVQFSHPEEREMTSVGKQGEGALIGEMSFFDRKPRNLRMSASGKGAQMLELTRPMYDRLKVEEPYIAVNILENAIVSLDNLVRHMGDDISALEHYMHGFGKH